jgi:predicted RNase H-like HicB family nuclease
VEVKRYTAECRRSGDWWAITVPELGNVFSQARRLDQVEDMARDAIALLLEVPADSFEVDVRPDVPDEVTAALAARLAAREAEERADRATIDAVHTLLDAGLTVRDAGQLLHLSPQRISQLAPKSSRANAA